MRNSALLYSVAAVALIAGCNSLHQKGGTLDEIRSSIKEKEKEASASGMSVGLTGSDSSESRPFVEGYVEYPGPQSKWAGPASFIVHVEAKEGDRARIEIGANQIEPSDKQVLAAMEK